MTNENANKAEGNSSGNTGRQTAQQSLFVGQLARRRRTFIMMCHGDEGIDDGCLPAINLDALFDTHVNAARQGSRINAFRFGKI